MRSYSATEVLELEAISREAHSMLLQPAAMAMMMIHGQQWLLLLALVVALIWSSGCFDNGVLIIGCHAYGNGRGESLQGFTSLRTVHKYSESARDIITARYGNDHAAAVEANSWPLEGSIEYYQMLRRHDRARLAAPSGRRHLLTSSSASSTTYTFAAGNETEQPFEDFFYAFIDIGTPSVEFFVALDTSAELLWVPCECKQCAPLSAPSADTRTRKLNEYSPSKSSTSKPVNCNNPLCPDKTTCASASQQCPYEESTNYVNTEASGLLFEDNMYFIPEQGGGRVSFPVVVGCGQNQTGLFLNGAHAPDGVLGLGTGDISVPSTLGRAGLLDSFSMCTGYDGIGRIVFGDKGPSNQQTTPFVSNSSSQNLVEITTLQVGPKSVGPVGLSATFATLIINTYLPAAVYTPFVDTYRTLVTLPTLNVTGFDLCYATNFSQEVEIPAVKVIFPNGETFVTAQGGVILITNEANGNIIGFCVGIINSTFTEIVIGLTFMYNYSFTYNQAENSLGWISSNCYDEISTSAPAPAPTVAPVPTPSSPSPTSPLPSPPAPPPLSSIRSPLPSAGFFVRPPPIVSVSLLGFILYLILF